MGNSKSSTFVQKYGQAILEPTIKYQAIMQRYCNYFKKLFRNEVLVFVYERFTEQDGTINIANSPKLAEIYLETEAYKNTYEAFKKINFSVDFIRLNLQSTAPLHNKFRVKMQEKLDLYTTFSVTEKCLNYNQAFSWIFRTPKTISLQEEQHCILQDYLNNLTTINFIIKHFKEQYCHRITQEFPFIQTPKVTIKKIEQFSLNKRCYSEHEDVFVNLLQDKILTKTDLQLHNIKFSYQELRCLHYYLQNMTSKEISNKMYLSRRTIENYINSIKEKFGAYNKSEIYEKVEKLQLLQKSVF